jgi:hypothetical protein
MVREEARVLVREEGQSVHPCCHQAVGRLHKVDLVTLSVDPILPPVLLHSESLPRQIRLAVVTVAGEVRLLHLPYQHVVVHHPSHLEGIVLIQTAILSEVAIPVVIKIQAPCPLHRPSATQE